MTSYAVSRGHPAPLVGKRFLAGGLRVYFCLDSCLVSVSARYSIPQGPQCVRLIAVGSGVHDSTLTFQIGVHIRLFIFRKSAALYDTIRVYTFIRFVANPPYTIFIWSMFISSPIL